MFSEKKIMTVRRGEDSSTRTNGPSCHSVTRLVMNTHPQPRRSVVLFSLRTVLFSILFMRARFRTVDLNPLRFSTHPDPSMGLESRRADFCSHPDSALTQIQLCRPDFFSHPDSAHRSWQPEPLTDPDNQNRSQVLATRTASRSR